MNISVLILQFRGRIQDIFPDLPAQHDHYLLRWLRGEISGLKHTHTKAQTPLLCVQHNSPAAATQVQGTTCRAQRKQRQKINRQEFSFMSSLGESATKLGYFKAAPDLWPHANSGFITYFSWDKLSPDTEQTRRLHAGSYSWECFKCLEWLWARGRWSKPVPAHLKLQTVSIRVGVGGWRPFRHLSERRVSWMGWLIYWLLLDRLWPPSPRPVSCSHWPPESFSLLASL